MKDISAAAVYTGSNGDLTRQYYIELAQAGPIGEVALNLMRAQKCSSRAKVYRGGVRGRGSYRDMAYERKAWSMSNLCDILAEHAAALGITWGWKIDPDMTKYPWVLYVDLPTGQVSFHNAHRIHGPDYPGVWDGERKSTERILSFCDTVYRTTVKITGGPSDGIHQQG